MSLTRDHKLSKLLKYFSLASIIAVLFLIVIGNILRTRGSEGACLQWTTCFSNWSLPDSFDTTIVYLHRALTLMVGTFQIVVVILAYLRYRYKLPALAYYLSAGLLLVQVMVGWILSTSFSKDISSWVSSFYTSLSLMVLAFMIFASVLEFVGNRGRFNFTIKSSLSIYSLFVIISLLIIFITGFMNSEADVSSLCTGWPFCENQIIPTTMQGWIDVLHRFSVLIVSILLVILLTKTWKSKHSNPIIMVSTTAAFVLYFSQALLASQMTGEFPVYQLVLHQTTAVAVWVTMIVQISYICTSDREIIHNPEILNTRTIRFLDKVRDLFLLTKPIVVALLLVTTFAGMVIGARSLPSLQLTIWTLLGGFMAAGGSGAINQYIDRLDDTKMQRTQKRPIPAGRLTPAEGLAFGVAMTLGSFYIMVAFVNLTAALLTLTGIIYYVLIYSIFLKKTTVQNIVIGGGAGAIPPLIGWAASTGELNIPSLFLFAIVFMWTPPHFWALALVRRKDYARAGVPMLPVVRGEIETRWQIFLYTIELTILTLLLPIFGLGGSIYFIGAIFLGLWILSVAWRLWKQGGNKLAWKMYRYSSMYLAFLFLVMMLDALI